MNQAKISITCQVIIIITMALIFTSCGLRIDLFELASKKENPNDEIDPFKLVDVMAISNSSVRVVFSHEVDVTSAETVGNYSIPGLSIISAMVNKYKNNVVDLETFPQQDIMYRLTVLSVLDINENELENHNSLIFHGDIPPSLLSASSISHTEVVIYFSEEVDFTTAKNTANYIISPDVPIASATRDVADWTKVTLITSSQSGAMTYTLTVNGVTDLTGNLVASPNSKDFIGTDPVDMTPPDVVSAVLVDSDTVEVH